jgi:molybdopterin synthase catalytic subunit
MDRLCIELTDEALKAEKYISFVTDPSAGAISTFIGTTRDNFQGKAVLHLEYEAFTPMALKEMKVNPYQICQRGLVQSHSLSLKFREGGESWSRNLTRIVGFVLKARAERT